MTVNASLPYGSAETLKPSTSWLWFSVNLQSAFGPHRSPFSPHWVVPAVNCRHKGSHLAECLTAKSYQENSLNVQTLHGYVSLHAHLYTLMCRNADVITQECSNLWPWTAQKCLGLKVCFLVTWPASTSSQEYIYPSVVPCLCGSTWNHKECGTDTNRDGPDHFQGPHKVGEPAGRQD